MQASSASLSVTQSSTLQTGVANSALFQPPQMTAWVNLPQNPLLQQHAISQLGTAKVNKSPAEVAAARAAEISKQLEGSSVTERKTSERSKSSSPSRSASSSASGSKSRSKSISKSRSRSRSISKSRSRSQSRSLSRPRSRSRPRSQSRRRSRSRPSSRSKARSRSYSGSPIKRRRGHSRSLSPIRYRRDYYPYYRSGRDYYGYRGYNYRNYYRGSYNDSRSYRYGRDYDYYYRRRSRSRERRRSRTASGSPKRDRSRGGRRSPTLSPPQKRKLASHSPVDLKEKNVSSPVNPCRSNSLSHRDSSSSYSARERSPSSGNRASLSSGSSMSRSQKVSHENSEDRSRTISQEKSVTRSESLSSKRSSSRSGRASKEVSVSRSESISQEESLDKKSYAVIQEESVSRSRSLIENDSMGRSYRKRQVKSQSQSQSVQQQNSMSRSRSVSLEKQLTRERSEFQGGSLSRSRSVSSHTSNYSAGKSLAEVSSEEVDKKLTSARMRRQNNSFQPLRHNRIDAASSPNQSLSISSGHKMCIDASVKDSSTRRHTHSEVGISDGKDQDVIPQEKEDELGTEDYHGSKHLKRVIHSGCRVSEDNSSSSDAPDDWRDDLKKVEKEKSVSMQERSLRSSMMGKERMVESVSSLMFHPQDNDTLQTAMQNGNLNALYDTENFVGESHGLSDKRHRKVVTSDNEEQASQLDKAKEWNDEDSSEPIYEGPQLPNVPYEEVNRTLEYVNCNEQVGDRHSRDLRFPSSEKAEELSTSSYDEIHVESQTCLSEKKHRDRSRSKDRKKLETESNKRKRHKGRRRRHRKTIKYETSDEDSESARKRHKKRYHTTDEDSSGGRKKHKKKHRLGSVHGHKGKKRRRHKHKDWLSSDSSDDSLSDIEAQRGKTKKKKRLKKYKSSKRYASDSETSSSSLDKGT
ncbi:hypothetical protein KP509_19G060700 [Ceratopteris richardii]|uniref:Uncharacterized protein n=1 Tax=Ceratopteris richardii TaxID=49495 RepID=A0A8T2SPZ6_CERRI|nr:hypothetical protein KP509_19G060700 [Ceratopteris richardii]